MKASALGLLIGVFLCFIGIGSILTSSYTSLKGVGDPLFKLWAAVLGTALVLPGFSALAGFSLVGSIFAVGGLVALAGVLVTKGFKVTPELLAFVVVWIGFVTAPAAGNELWKTIVKSKTVVILTVVSWLGLGFGSFLAYLPKLLAQMK
jgi:hypothetical protein